MSATKVVQSFCDRIGDVDPDLRQMALFDLHQAVTKADFLLSDGDQDRISKQVLKCFTVSEVNSEVHSKAVHLLSVLVCKIPRMRTHVVIELIKILWDIIPDCKSPEVIRSLRDNASMGLKSVLEGLQVEHKDTVAAAVPALLTGLSTVKDPKIRMDIYDIIAEILKKFGSLLADKHAEIQAHAIKDFDGDLALRKRAVNCVAVLCQYSADALFEQVLALTLSGLQKDKGEKLRRHIQLCNTISRVAGNRFGASVAKVVPFFFSELTRLEKAPQEESESVAADEARENILQAIECFVSRCPDFVAPLLPTIVSNCATLLKWDPNYCEIEGEEDLEEEEEEMLDDGEDISWRVRKAAACVLLASVKALPNQLPLFYGALASSANPLLHSRFRERVENVRLQVFDVMRAMFEASKISFSTEGAEGAAHQGSGSFQVSQELMGGSFRMAFEASPEVSSLIPIKKEFVQALLASLRHKSPKVKLSCVLLLRETFALLGAELTGQVPDCAAALVILLRDPTLALPHLRPDVLNLTRVLVAVAVRLFNQDPDGNAPTIGPALESLFTPVFACADDRYFKTVVAALHVCYEMVAAVPCSRTAAQLAAQLFDCVQTKLMTADTDQEVKRAAIEAMSHTLRFLGENYLCKTKTADVEKSYQQLLVLLHNETTRLYVTKALPQLVRCRLSKDTIKGFAAELMTLLRKSDRQLREASLRALICWVREHAGSIDDATLKGIADEVCNENTALLSEKELFLTSLGLQLLRTVAAAPSQGKTALTVIAPRVLAVMATPLMGHTVRDAGMVVQTIATRTDVPFGDLLAQTMDAVKKADANNIPNLSVLVGVVVGADTDAARRLKVVAEFAGYLKTSGKEVVGLGCLGEVGRNVPLQPDVVTSITACFGPGGRDDAKNAAASALGKAASSSGGNAILQVIFSGVRDKAAERYFYLRSLREAIHSAAGLPQTPFGTDDVRNAAFTLLFAHAGSGEEGVADIVSECLGKYAQLNVHKTLASMAEAIPKASPEAQATMIHAAKLAVMSLQRPDADAAFAAFLDAFLQSIVLRGDVSVRRASLQLLTAVAISKTSLLLTENMKTKYFGAMLKELEVDKSLIKEVDLGPFKHIVDKGLELRKVAFEAASTIVDGSMRPRSILDFVQGHNGLVEKLAGALGAPEQDLEIQAIARKMISKVSKTPAGSAAVLAHLDKIVPMLHTTITTSAKDGQEKDKVTEGQKWAVVCALKLEGVPGVLAHAKFAELSATARKSTFFEQARSLLSQE